MEPARLSSCTRTAFACRCLRFWCQAQHPAYAGRPRLQGDGSSSADIRRRGTPAPAGWHISLQRPRGSRALRLRHHSHSRSTGQRCADLRHLPRSPAPGTGFRRQDPEDEVWPPWGQPPGQGSPDQASPDHQPEPRLCGRRRQPACESATDTRIAIRRVPARHRPQRRAGFFLSRPP